MEKIVEDEQWGGDCLWSYIDARDVATACQAWLESDHQGAEIFNLAAANVHQDVPFAQFDTNECMIAEPQPGKLISFSRTFIDSGSTEYIAPSAASTAHPIRPSIFRIETGLNFFCVTTV